MEVKRRTARTLVHRLRSDSDETRMAALCEVRLLSKSEPDIRPMLASEGAIPILADALYSTTSISQENAGASILNLSISVRESVISTPGILDSLSHVLRHHSSSASATLFSLLVDESFRKTVGSRTDILSSLIHIITNPNSSIQPLKDALNALFGIALYAPNRGGLIDLGAVPPLFSLVGSQVADDATAVIALVAGCGDAAEAFRRVSGVGVLVDLIDPAMGGSRKVRENAVSALLNLVKFSEEDVKDEIRRIGGEGRVYDAVMDMVERGSPKEKTKANALLRALGDVTSAYNINLSSRDSSATVSNSLTTNSNSS